MIDTPFFLPIMKDLVALHLSLWARELDRQRKRKVVAVSFSVLSSFQRIIFRLKLLSREPRGFGNESSLSPTRAARKKGHKLREDSWLVKPQKHGCLETAFFLALINKGHLCTNTPFLLGCALKTVFNRNKKMRSRTIFSVRIFVEWFWEENRNSRI